MTRITKLKWLITLACVLGLIVFHAPLLTGVAAFMTIGHALAPADLILPLYHEAHTVPFAAAALYRQGYADRIALARPRPRRLETLGLIPPEHQVWRGALESEGIPPQAIIAFGHDIENEVEMAKMLATFLRENQQSRVIVVVSAYMSRLSYNDFQRGLAGAAVDLRMYPVRPREFDEHTWWRNRHGLVTYFDVYYLWLLRWLRN